MIKLNVQRVLLTLVILLSLFIILQKEKPGTSHWLGFNQREISLSTRLRESEDQVRWLGRQLRLVQQQRRLNSSVKSPTQQNSTLTFSCDTIHICIVCSGLDTARNVVTLLKSILFYRKNPLVFHFISDDSAQSVLSHLDATWQLQHTRFRFYPAKPVLSDVAWIPNKHYSGVYGLLKLTLPKILPKTLDRVIVLDTDVVVNTDIGRLWNMFSTVRHNKKACLGLVENQSDWYIPGKLWPNHRPWPALGRGYNTGVILMDLARLREISWHTMWRTVAEHNLMTLLSTSLADQDIMNTLIQRHPGLAVTLPCTWNIQLSQHSLYQSICQEKTKEVNIIHFNSPDKLKLNNVQLPSKYFQNLLHAFQQLDGCLVQEALIQQCNDHVFKDPVSSTIESLILSEDPDPVSSHPECQQMREAGTRIYRTHLFYLPYTKPGQNNEINNNINSINSNINNITFVATLSFDRLHALEGLLSKWSGPVSLALYLTDSEAARFTEFYLSSNLMKSRSNVGYHVVYKESWYYPVNYLRNVAKQHVDTDYIFLCDIDFLPSEDMEIKLSEYLYLLERKQTTALIVPAFESERYRIDSLPGTKADLLKQLDLGEMIKFRSRVWEEGHSATNYQKWKGSTQPYQVVWQVNYEPYIVTHKSVPDYDQRFVGFGWNKASHIYQIYRQGYKFLVLPNVFIIHLPHSPSIDIHRYRTSSNYRHCMTIFKEEFMNEIDAKVLESSKDLSD